MLCLLASAALTLVVSALVHEPHKLDFAELKQERHLKGIVQKGFEKALATHGLVQVAAIPGFADLRRRTMSEAHSCIAEAPHAQITTFQDGTVRRTLAAASGKTFGLQGVDHGSDTESCRRFEDADQALREVVGTTADGFAKKLGSIIGFDQQRGFLERKSGGSFTTVEEAVQAGERLYHFHSYQMPDVSSSIGEAATMDFHIDQGLFIVFAPAMMVGDGDAQGTSAGSFAIKSKHGEEFDVRFDSDSLVILLGDAVNLALKRVHREGQLHVPSHAFRMPRDGRGQHRVWYGMMQLPPADAFVPGLGMTFGELRAEVIKAVDASDPASETVLSAACSRQLQARELSDNPCNETQIYCWHRCYPFTAEVSPEVCAAKDLGFECTNQFDQIYVSGHGDFTPKCTNSTTIVSPRPPVVQPTGACVEWEGTVNDPAYTHKVALYEGEAYLLWNVVNDMMEAKMVSKGLVGWMAVGTEYVGGKKNGMQGASIVMGRSIPNQTPTVGEYMIDHQDSAFRHWKTPRSQSVLTDTSFVSSGCVSTLKFKTASIYDVNLNLTAGSSNRLVWARTWLDYPTDDFGGYSGYHTDGTFNPAQRPRFRGRVTVDFSSGASEPTMVDEMLAPSPIETDPASSAWQIELAVPVAFAVATAICASSLAE